MFAVPDCLFSDDGEGGAFTSACTLDSHTHKDRKPQHALWQEPKVTFTMSHCFYRHEPKQGP